MPAADPTRQPEAVAEFLAKVPPFDRLSERDRIRLAGSSRVVFHLSDEVVVAPGEKCPGVGCVQRGGLRLCRPDRGGPGEVLDFRGEGECCGMAWALAGTPADCWALAVGDTFLVRLDGGAFAAMAARHPMLVDFVRDGLAEVPGAVPGGSDGDAQVEDARHLDGDYLFTRRVGEVATASLVGADRGTSLRQVARIMEQGQVGSVVVREVSGTVIGIVTERDLRRAVADGLAVTAPVETLMSAPVAAIAAEASCFEALARMTEAGIRHLGVLRDGALAGLVTANDLLLAHGRSPMALLRAIRRAGDDSEVAALCRRTRSLAAALAARGGTAGAVGGILTMVAEGALDRLLSLLGQTLGPPPAPYCALALDRFGRGELLPGSGLAVALVADPGGDAIVARAARTYVNALADRLSPQLSACGAGLVEAGLSLADADNRTDIETFCARRRALLAGPDLAPEDPRLGLFDARPVAGDRALARAMRERLAVVAAEDRPVLNRLLGEAAGRPVPLRVFQGRLMERDGGSGPVLDLDARACRPLTVLARLAALGAGLVETATDARLARLGREGRLPDEVADAARRALAFFESLRLQARLEGREEAEAADRPVLAALSASRRRAVKAGFDAVRSLGQALAGGTASPGARP